jgi:peptidyl-prolyl cis-trans isomerase D
MAVIGSIRKRSGLLIVIIGVALLLFLLGDLFSGGSSLFTQQDVALGKIAGKEINQREYEIRVQETIGRSSGPEGATEQAKKQVRERVWIEMINELITFKEYGNLGISVSPEELLDQVQNTTPGSILYQYFSDPNTGQVIEQFRDPQTGGLDSRKVLTTVQNIINSENAKDWLPIEAAIKEDVKNSKYRNLVGKGLYTTNSEAESINIEKNASMSFSYVLKEFMSIPDEQIEVTDSDYQAYYNSHKDEALFKSEEESRDIKFVSFNLVASNEDLAEIESEMNAMKELFVSDTNDTAFILDNAESDIENLSRYFTVEELMPQLKDTIQESEIGTVFGPISNGSTFQITKLSAIDMAPDSVQASHILVKIEDGDTIKINAAKAKLDSLKSVAQSKKNFAELAKEFSDDLGSAEKGGELDWFTRGRMVPEFETASFAGKTGDMIMVETQFGVHLIYITDQTEAKPRYLLSSVDMLIEPSKFTANSVYSAASKFSVENKSIESFESNKEYAIEPAEGLRAIDPGVPVIGPNSKEVLRWIFAEETEVGSVSTPFELEDKIVVVAVTNIREKGTISIESAKPFMSPEIVNKKKADQFMAEFGNYSTLEEAGSNTKKDIQKVSSARFDDNNLSGGLGNEPKLVGAVSALESGNVSKTIIGNRGVFVARLDGVTNPAEGTDLTQVKSVKNNNYSSRADRKAQDALQKAMGVEDNRGRYY